MSFLLIGKSSLAPPSQVVQKQRLNKETKKLGRSRRLSKRLTQRQIPKAGSTNTQTGIKRKQRLMVNVERSKLISAFSPD